MINEKKLHFEIISKKLTYPKAGRKDTFLWDFLLCLLYDYSESLKKGDTHAYTRTNRKLISKFFNKGM
ncbi:hypothetical protein DY470_15095 [Bacillus anthracis]|nr:hypothetical protein DY470_15095 [Bacillus anthracis]